MPPRISLALALHNHQPVGNFGWVFAEVYDQAYGPMIDALERHPGVRLSLHYTGSLLTWIAAERPDAIERLRALVARDQVEILGGGFFEPVLVSLPERDRIGQLTRMADELESMFGRRPRGAWIAERVWEPDLPTSLVVSGYDWTILDDAHFRAAAVPEDGLWGPYTTEDQGNLIRVFGTEQGLRYRIPFREVDEVIDYLRQHATEAGDRVGMMGDDGEKFGGWPTTWEHSWGKSRWVERFFEALDANQDWLTTVTPSAWLAEHPPIGRVYIPTGSYIEMGEWALPPEESLVFSEVLHRAQEEKRPEARWLRGASWRNFQVKYREINDLHKRMLRVSKAVAAIPDGAGHDQATEELYQGQCNDCYWHGLFGGIYIPHLRLATWEHLIAAEDLAETAAGTLVTAESRDLDMDGVDEVRLSDAGQVVTVDLGEGGGIGGWDIRAVRHAVAAVMRRRPEAYHLTLREFDAAAARVGDGGGDAAPASIHGVVRVKEAGLAARLVYDRYERRSGLIRALAGDVSAEDWARAADDIGDAVDGAFDLVELVPGRLVTRREASIAGATVLVTRTLTLGGDRRTPTLSLQVDLEHREGPPLDARIGLEWSTTMLGGGGNPAAWWDAGAEGGGRWGHDAAGSATNLTSIAQGNDHIGIAITTTTDEPADAWWAPIETISNSEAGFERVYQGSGLLLSWQSRLAAGDRWSRTVRHVVETARDRGLEAS